MGVSKLMDLLSENREVIRNDVSLGTITVWWLVIDSKRKSRVSMNTNEFKIEYRRDYSEMSYNYCI